MRIVQLSVNRPIAMSMLVAIILLFGLISLFQINIDLFPAMDIPMAAVTLSYPGVGPKEMEQLVTEPLESILSTLPNLVKLSSTSSLGGSLITLEFDYRTEMNEAIQLIRERIDLVRNTLPEGFPSPILFRFDPQILPIIQLGITSEKHTPEELETIVDKTLKPQLDRIPGVAFIRVDGSEQKELHLRPKEGLDWLKSTFAEQMDGFLHGENMDIPLGIVLNKNRQVPIRMVGEMGSVEELKSLPLPIPYPLSHSLTLGDMAEVKLTPNLEQSLAFINGSPALSIQIQKQSDANVVEVSRNVFKVIKELKEELPDGVRILPIFNQATFIEESIESLGWNILIGSLLSAAILYLFLGNMRGTLIVSLSIPISIIATFVFLYFSNQTLNLLTLGGLALGVGMMVDNAIITQENIVRYYRKGFSLKKSTIKGIKEIGMPVVASTATTISVFLPIFFVEGFSARLFKPMALSVSFALLASLFTSFIVVPILFARFLPLKSTRPTERLLLQKLEELYANLLKKALQYKKSVLALFFIAFLISLLFLPAIGLELLPKQDQGIVQISYSLPYGTHIDETKRLTEEIQRRIKGVKEVKDSFYTVGNGGAFSYTPSSQSHKGYYFVQLVDKKLRKKTAEEIASEITSRLANLNEAKIYVNALNPTFDTGNGKPIHLKITGRDPFVLEQLAKKTVQLLSETKIVQNLESDVDATHPEIRLLLDRERAASYGLTSSLIANQLHYHLTGTKLAQLKDGEKNLQVRLISNSPIQNLDILHNLDIQTPKGEIIPLGFLATIEEGLSPVSIKKENRLRQVSVKADLTDLDLGKTVREIRKNLKENLPLPTGYSVIFGGDNEQMVDAFRKLSAALAIAIIVVYMLLAAQFESVLYPFMIMLSVLLSFTGVIAGLLITGHPFNIGSMIGLLILVGISVNNGIVLIDFISNRVKKNDDPSLMIIEASRTRLRPILMTTLTTILGLLPLAFGIGQGSEFQIPLAIVLIFGLTFSTVTSLFFIPILYHFFHHWQRKIRGREVIFE